MKRRILATAIAMALGASAVTAQAEVIGTMAPPPALTEASLGALAGAERAAWQAYLEQSRRLMARSEERRVGKECPV